MLNIANVRERFLCHGIFSIGFIQSNNNLADGLAKCMNESVSPLASVMNCTVLVTP